MSKSKSIDLADQIADDLKKVIENLDEQEDVVKLKKQAKEVAVVATEFIREYPVQFNDIFLFVQIFDNFFEIVCDLIR